MNNREFFNKLAPKWDETTSHDSKKIEKIIQLSSIEKGAKILDIGSGTGILLSYFLETLPLSITAVDISDNMILRAKQKYRDDRITFIRGDIIEYTKEKDFNYLFLYSAYPHFKDKDKLFSHLLSLASYGGKIVIAHSMGREEINKIHEKNCDVKDHSLPPVEVTAEIMSKYFKVDKMIDNREMYYISGIKV